MATKASKTLGQSSDLVVLAPWKPGIIGADEAIMPYSRWARTFNALFQIRRTAREAAEPQAFSDPIERLEQVHSFRMKATDAGMLLSVTYDFGWDSYMRTLWKDARPFLDLLLCDCAGYRLARDTGVDDWASWIRANEQVSDYFYSATPLTVGDLMALSQEERLQRDEPDPVAGDRRLATFSSRAPGSIAAESQSRAPSAALQQALGVLSGMFRLTRFYGSSIASTAPLGEDAYTLLLATRALLPGFDPDEVPSLERQRFSRELAWYTQPEPIAPPAMVVPAEPPVARADVQRGILSGFDKPGQVTDRITHGAMLFFMVHDREKARKELAKFEPASEMREVPGDGIYRNLAFTYRGMVELGVPADMLKAMPDALREGAAARAGQVGDVRAFHPMRWRPLEMNWPKPAPNATAPTVDIGVVDLVIQLRVTADGKPDDIHDPAHPLYAEVTRLAGQQGLKLLSVQSTGPANPDKPGHDHFGLSDGISQPTIDETRSQSWSDTVAAGELLVGYSNGAQDAFKPLKATQGGSFLAIRSMILRPGNLDRLLMMAAAETGLAKDIITGKLVGRSANGTPLVPHQGINDFLYSDDPGGSLCPRQSHVRRVNPRQGNIPRLVRRGMSFKGKGEGERGTLFMAYCANLGEQYEVVLRWINGANSTRLASQLADPLCGVPEAARTRTFRFEHEGKTYRIPLPIARDAPVLLAWSLYLFAPPISFLKSLKDSPVPAPAEVDEKLETRAQKIIEKLTLGKAPMDLWRPYLDEPGAQVSGLQSMIWKLIRKGGGIVVTPDMVLVGSHAHIIEVMRDDGTRFSVRGAGRRIAPSIEKFHLGLDGNTPAYQREAPACNQPLRGVSEAAAFEASRTATKLVIAGLLQGRTPPLRVDVMRDLLEPAMAEMAKGWFGFPDGEYILAGPSDWRPVGTRKPLFPGDYWNSSRYAFNPFISIQTERLSAEHGQAILNATERYIADKGRGAVTGSVSQAIATAMHDGTLAFPEDRDLARGIAGSMLGWISTTLGNAARLFDRWVPTSTLSRLQVLWADEPLKDGAHASAVFGDAMKATICAAPVPENKWREVVNVGQMLGGKNVRPDNNPKMMVLGLQSAAADQRERGIVDSYVPFGSAMPGTGPDTVHGCPAREMALGVLMGVVAALAETVVVRDGGGRLVVDIIPRP